MSTIAFRPMTAEDIDSIVALEVATFSLPWGRDSFESELSNILARYILLEEDGQLAGYAGMWLVLDEAHIMNVAIEASRRGRGLGLKLMNHMIQLAANECAERMTLEVRRSNLIALNLYRQIGFRECGVRPGYYSDNGEDALLLWLEGLSDKKNSHSRG